MSDTVTINGGRHYIVKTDDQINYLPSVTTIISSMSDDKWLDDWKKRIGEEKANAISKFSANRGTCMHMFNENYLSSTLKNKKDKLLDTLEKTSIWGINEGFTPDEIEVGRKLFFNFYNAQIFDKVKEVIIQEKMLYNFMGGGYAGRVDLIYADSLDNHVICDFKTSKKPKQYEWVDNYKMQLSAYYVAYYKMTGKLPSHAEIWISNEQDYTPQIFTVSKNEIKKYFKDFMNGVIEYHKKYKIN